MLADELIEFERSGMKFRYIRTAIENKILSKVARIISGEASAAHMLEQGALILDAVQQMKAATSEQQQF